MSKPKRYEEITQPEEFVRQAWHLTSIISNLCAGLKYGSPHYVAISDLQGHIAETVRQVTGKEPPWRGNGPIAGLPQYAQRKTGDASRAPDNGAPQLARQD